MSNKKQADDMHFTLAGVAGLIFAVALMTMTLIVANFAAVKIWNLGGIPVDAGILLFPISYIIGDLLVEIYGRRTADLAAWASCVMGGLTVLVIALAAALPDYPGIDNAAFQIMSGVAGRVFIASIIGFIASQLLNNYVFDKIRMRQKTDSFTVRALVSSILAHIPDVLLFEPIAFLGRLSLGEFLEQASFAYATSVLLEVILLVCVTGRLAKYAVKKIGMKNGERVE